MTLLTKAQQKHITKTLQSVATSIRDEQANEKEHWDRTVGARKDLMLKGMHHGRQAAYENAYHIAKSAAEQSYSEENSSLIDDLEQLAIKLEAQAKAFEKLNADLRSIPIPGELLDAFIGQRALLENFVKQLRLIIKQTEQT